MPQHRGFKIVSTRSHGNFPLESRFVVVAMRGRITVEASVPLVPFIALVSPVALLQMADWAEEAVNRTIDRLLCPCTLRGVSHLN